MATPMIDSPSSSIGHAPPFERTRDRPILLTHDADVFPELLYVLGRELEDDWVARGVGPLIFRFEVFWLRMGVCLCLVSLQVSGIVLC